MSDLEVVATLDALERLLQDSITEPETILAWRERFEAALVGAEHGPGWPDIVTRARALSGQLDAVAERLSAQKDLLRKELGLQAQGARALKGYKPA